MRLCRRRVEEEWYMFELYGEDFERVEESLELKCSMCGKPATVRLKVTGEVFCERCKRLNTSIALPRTHPECIAADKRWKERRQKRAPKLTEQQRAQMVMNEVFARSKAQGTVEQEEIMVICAKHDVEFFKWMRKYRPGLRPQEVPLGGTVEDMQAASSAIDPQQEIQRLIEERKAQPEERKRFSWDEQNDEYLIESAIEQINDGLDIDEVCEELGVDRKVVEQQMKEKTRR